MISKHNKKIFLKSLTLKDKYLLIDRILETKKDRNYHIKLRGWKMKVGESSEDYFLKRLEWSNISESNLHKILSPVKKYNFDNYDFPDWILELQKFQNSNYSKYPYDELTLKTKDIPYSDFLLPFIQYFSSKITVKNKYISKKALISLKISLLEELSNLSSQSLLEQMSLYGLNYENFIEESKKENYRTFTSEYSYLCRLIFTRGQFWVINTNKFLDSLNNDYKEILKKIKVKSFIVKNIISNLSETHNFGQNIMVVETNNKRKFLYKQRSTDIEEKFFDLVKYLNTNLSIKQYVPWIINMRDRSWVEYIDYKESKTIEDVKNYYKRCGYFLSLFYVLGTTDLHSENIIASGEFPVFIDIETLITPRTLLNNKNLNKLNDYIDDKYGLSVSRIGILPQWLLGPDTNIYSNSAIGGSKTDIRYPAIIWKNINKDGMSYEYQGLPSKKDKNSVIYNKEVQSPINYLKEITFGFNQCYDFLVQKKDDAEFIDRVKKFSKTKVRFVFRATKVYTLLTEYLNHPDYMKDGITRSLEFEILAKGLLMDTSKKYIFWDIFEDELEHLQVNDIPHYICNTTELGLYSIYGKVVKKAFQCRGLDKVLNNLQKLNSEDKAFQLEIINNSIRTDILYDKNDKFLINRRGNLTKTNREEIVKIILDIGDKIIKSKLEIDNRCTWVSYVSNIVSHTYGYKPVGLDIANGNMGIAIFLAALYKYTKNDLYLEQIKLTVNPIIDILKKDWSTKEFVSRFETGITTGVGSIIYGFIKIFEFTDKKKYLKYALKFTEIVSKDDVEKAHRQDIVSGNAGLLLAYIKLYELTKDQNSINMINYIYNHLIKIGFCKDKFINWDYQQYKKIIGFSHGSSGVLYAISRAYPYLKNQTQAIKNIKSIIDYEKRFYEPKENNWYDLRFEEPNIGTVSWCNGGLGVGMSRLELLKNNLLTNSVKKDINNSINKVVDTQEHYLDTVCCGNGGRIDFMLELKKLNLNDKKTDTYLKNIISKVIDRYKKCNDFRYFSNFDTEELNVGFFQGLSGIGYELIRYLNPQDFPSILLFN